MNTYYLEKSQIQEIVGQCEYLLSKVNKIELKRIQSKYNLVLTCDKKTNTNLMWQHFSDELMQNTSFKNISSNKTYKELYMQTNSHNILMTDLLKSYINQYYKEDYEFISEFNIYALLRDINSILWSAYMRLTCGTLNELLEVDNYFKYFDSKYGISACDKKAVKSTEKLTAYFDNLLQDIPNKAIFFQAMTEYLQTGDQAVLHNKLHKN